MLADTLRDALAAQTRAREGLAQLDESQKRMLENYVAPYTATCVQRMLDAGCLPLGKLNMDEFAFGSSTENSAFVPRNLRQQALKSLSRQLVCATRRNPW